MLPTLEEERRITVRAPKARLRTRGQDQILFKRLVLGRAKFLFLDRNFKVWDKAKSSVRLWLLLYEIDYWPAPARADCIWAKNPIRWYLIQNLCKICVQNFSREKRDIDNRNKIYYYNYKEGKIAYSYRRIANRHERGKMLELCFVCFMCIHFFSFLLMYFVNLIYFIVFYFQRWNKSLLHI